jgi:hypothetical protein
LQLAAAAAALVDCAKDWLGTMGELPCIAIVVCEKKNGTIALEKKEEEYRQWQCSFNASAAA